MLGLAWVCRRYFGFGGGGAMGARLGGFSPFFALPALKKDLGEGPLRGLLAGMLLLAELNNINF